MLKVSLLKCKDYQQKRVDNTIKKALSLIDFKIPKNKKILLKPNVLGHFAGARSKAITTDLAIITAVAKLFKDNKIYLGDSSGQADTRKALRETHIEELCKKLKISLVNFDTAEKVKVNFHNQFLKTSYIAKILKEADLIINLPKLKTHTFMQYTGAIKNLYGCIPGSLKWKLHDLAKTQENFAKILVSIYEEIKPDLNVMDGVVGMDGNGPSMGNPRASGIILASKDALALDLAATKIIGFEEVLTNKIAIERALKKEFEIVGEKNISRPYKKPSTSMSLFTRKMPSFIRERFFKKELALNKKKCKKCGLCAKVCPVNAISYHPYPIWNFKKCIHCHCCLETCPYHAIYIKENKIFTTMLSLMRKLKG